MKRTTSAPRLPKGARFVVCVSNDGYQASLERNKIYIFAAERFIAVELPQAVQASVRRASGHAAAGAD
jgi:hypothetical protein